MNEANLQKEFLARDAHIALAELEVSKAAERVAQLKYEKAKFMLDVQTEINKQQEEQLKTIKKDGTNAI
jgi:hypothetical protein